MWQKFAMRSFVIELKPKMPSVIDDGPTDLRTNRPTDVLTQYIIETASIFKKFKRTFRYDRLLLPIFRVVIKHLLNLEGEKELRGPHR